MTIQVRLTATRKARSTSCGRAASSRSTRRAGSSSTAIGHATSAPRAAILAGPALDRGLALGRRPGSRGRDAGSHLAGARAAAGHQALALLVLVREVDRDAAPVLLDVKEGIHHVRVEMGAAGRDDRPDDLVVRQRALVDARARERVVDVDQGDHPAGDGNRLPAQTLWVP